MPLSLKLGGWKSGEEIVIEGWENSEETAIALFSVIYWYNIDKIVTCDNLDGRKNT